MKNWFIKKCLPILALACLSAVTLAQSDLTQTYTGESVTFQYPTEWQAIEDTPNRINLRSESVEVNVFVSALTTQSIKLTDLINNLLQSSGVADPAIVPTSNADGSIEVQATLTDGKLLYLKGYAEADGGVVFVRATLTNANDITLVNAVLDSLAPTVSGSRYYASTNDQISLRQPIGFTISNPVDGFLVLSNTIDLLPPPMGELPMLSGTLQIFVFSDLGQVPNYDPQEGDTTEEILFAYINPTACPEPSCKLGDYLPISSVANVTGSELKTQFTAVDNLSLAVTSPDALPLVFSAYSAPSEMDSWLGIISTVVGSAKRQPIAFPQIADTITPLEGLNVAHPTGWSITKNPDANVYSLVSDATAGGDINNIQANQVLAFIIPDVATLKTASSYSAELTPETMPSTIISYFASVATLNNGTQKNEMEVGTINARDYAGVIIVPEEGNFEQQIFVMRDGNGDFITLLAYVRTGWVEKWQPVLRDILAKTAKTQ
jgi:hypothetical protein